MQPDGATQSRSAFGATFALAAALAAGLLLAAAAIAGLVPVEGYLRVFVRLHTAEQNQSAKTAVYLLGLVVLLPATALLAPRLARRIVVARGSEGLVLIAAAAGGGLAAVVLLVRISRGLPWADGLRPLLVALALWALLLAALVRWALRPGRVARAAAVGAAWLAGAMVLIALLALAKRASVQALPVAIGAGAMLVVAGTRRAGAGWWTGPHVPRRAGRLLDVVAVIVLVLAIVPTVVIDPSAGIPNSLLPPGILQFHQDFLLGPANQLLRGGGALLVNVPTSQYGVGTIYLLHAWFHLLPIGYGTYGLLDGVLTALFYAGGYLVLRVAGVGRLLSTSAIGVGVLALLYSLHYPVGQLPQQGPLRFGLPMVVILGLVAGASRPRVAGIGRMAALVAVGLSAVWALEAFAFTGFTFVAMIGLEAALRPRRTRGRWVARALVSAAGAAALAHVVLALWTLAATGSLPHWSQYLAYVKAFVLGGQAGQVVYGFERFSPGLAVGVAVLSSGVGVILLVTSRPQLARRRRPAVLALGGLTALAAALFSYTDNRSSTYLLPYVTLPLLLCVTLWLGLALDRAVAVPRPARTGLLLAAMAVGTVVIAVAWPGIRGHFNRSLLADAYPGSGLRTALHGLLHPPPVDPRAPTVDALLRRYVPGRRVLVVLPLTPDLAIESLVRGGRASRLFSGDPKADSFVPSVWVPTVSRQLASLAPGTRMVTDDASLALLPALRAANCDPLRRPVGLGLPQPEWVLQHLDRRYRMQPLARSGGFVVEQLLPRG